MSLVGQPMMPILSSALPQLTPGLFISTMKVVMPLLPLLGSVLQKTMAKSEMGAAVMKHLRPLMIQSSPSRTAEVDTALASEPAPGSVRAKQGYFLPSAMGRRYFSSCSGVPASSRGPLPRELAPLM